MRPGRALRVRTGQLTSRTGRLTSPRGHLRTRTGTLRGTHRCCASSHTYCDVPTTTAAVSPRTDPLARSCVTSRATARFSLSHRVAPGTPKKCVTPSSSGARTASPPWQVSCPPTLGTKEPPLASRRAATRAGVPLRARRSETTRIQVCSRERSRSPGHGVRHTRTPSRSMSRKSLRPPARIRRACAVE
jgi:hypothetical protein